MCGSGQKLRATIATIFISDTLKKQNNVEYNNTHRMRRFITEPCKTCGQSTYITRISREDLELIDESPLGRAKELLRIRTEAAQKFLMACTDIDVFCNELGMDVFNPEFCLGMDFRIWGETDGCYRTTLHAIEQHLKEATPNE